MTEGKNSLKVGEGGGREFGADEALQRQLNAAAHRRAHLLVRRGRQPQRLLGVDDAAVDGAKIVHQGAIQVIENGLARGAGVCILITTRNPRGVFKTEPNFWHGSSGYPFRRRCARHDA